MAKEIIVNADMAEEVRIAILEDGKLIDLDIETISRAKHKGNIYKGIVSNIEDSLDAAFIEFGEERQAFLPLAEIRPDIYPADLAGQKRPKVSQILTRGQEVVVQVTKDEIGTKGAAVSTYLSIPGRFVVLMHSDDSGGGISRKIENESARQAARDMLSRLNVPEGMAVIIRTAGTNATRQDLFRDFRALCEIWTQISKGAELGRAPTLLYREPDIVVRTVRDYVSGEVSRIVVDDEDEFEDAQRYFSEFMPDLVKILEKHRKKEPIFQSFGIEQAIEELFERQVKLPSGGYIIIEQTEALVSIDVNSGKSTQEEGHAATVYKTNLEAAEEVARQLRLRDMGGIVVIDFIDMLSAKHNRDVERRLRDLMRLDKARVKLGIISENGTLELTRQRLRQSHQLISHVQCDHCAGTGRVRDAEGLALLALRKIRGHLTKKRVALATLTVRMPLSVANVLNNQKRRELIELCDSHQLNIQVLGDTSYLDSDIQFSEEKRGQAGIAAAAHNQELWHESSGRKRSYGKHSAKGEQWIPPKANLPAPTIGPVPSLTEIDELKDQWIAEEKPIPLRTAANVEHFDDPLTEALFGYAPDIDPSLIKQEHSAEEGPALFADESNAEPGDSGDSQADFGLDGEAPLASQDQAPRNDARRFHSRRGPRRPFGNKRPDNRRGPQSRAKPGVSDSHPHEELT